MTISYRASGSNFTGATTSHVMSIPAGAVAGDLIVYAVKGSTTSAPPTSMGDLNQSKFSQNASGSELYRLGANSWVATFHKVLTSGDISTGSFTITTGSATGTQWCCVVLSTTAAWSRNPVRGVNFKENASVTTHSLGGAWNEEHTGMSIAMAVAASTTVDWTAGSTSFTERRDQAHTATRHCVFTSADAHEGIIGISHYLSTDSAVDSTTFSVIVREEWKPGGSCYLKNAGIAVSTPSADIYQAGGSSVWTVTTGTAVGASFDGATKVGDYTNWPVGTGAGLRAVMLGGGANTNPTVDQSLALWMDYLPDDFDDTGTNKLLTATFYWASGQINGSAFSDDTGIIGVRGLATIGGSTPTMLAAGTGNDAQTLHYFNGTDWTSAGATIGGTVFSGGNGATPGGQFSDTPAYVRSDVSSTFAWWSKLYARFYLDHDQNMGNDGSTIALNGGFRIYITYTVASVASYPNQRNRSLKPLLLR